MGSHFLTNFKVWGDFLQRRERWIHLFGNKMLVTHWMFSRFSFSSAQFLGRHRKFGIQFLKRLIVQRVRQVSFVEVCPDFLDLCLYIITYYCCKSVSNIPVAKVNYQFSVYSRLLRIVYSQNSFFRCMILIFIIQVSLFSAFIVVASYNILLPVTVVQ